MINILEYFRTILPEYISRDRELFHSGQNKYIYMPFQSGNTSITFKYFVSKDYFVIAKTGSTVGYTFLNDLELYKRDLKSWRKIGADRFNSIIYSESQVFNLSKRLLEDYLNSNIMDERVEIKAEMDIYISNSINQLFSNQFQNLFSLYFGEL